MQGLTMSSSTTPSSSLNGIIHQRTSSDNRKNRPRLIQSPRFAIFNHTKPSIVPNYGGKLPSWGRSNEGYRRNYCVNQEREAAQPQFVQGRGNVGSNSSSPSTSFLSFLCPLLKLFSAGDPSSERNYLIEETTSSLASLARFPWGSRSISHGLTGQDPPILMQLYEFEACPFCRRVREAITELDLAVEVYPCPKGSLRHREIVKSLGGKEQFPFLVDPNTGTSMYESGDIVKYLYQQYGGKRNPSFGILESTLVNGWVPTLVRAGKGMTRWENSVAEAPKEKLELFSYENNSHARIVREALYELELPYVLQSVGRGSKRAKVLAEVSSVHNEVPYLVDRNSGVEIGGYKKILSYLFRTYSCASA